MINNKPNIFEYATKELSQDAVFCYILDCFNDSEKREIATDFLSLINFPNIEKIKEISIKRQEDHSDIKAIVTFSDNRKKIILFEDKVFTSLHDNQLEHYKENTIKRHKCTDTDIIGIYFRIGKPTIWESQNCEEFNFRILDYIKFAEYLNRIAQNDIILKTFNDFYQLRVSFCNRIDKLDFDTIDEKTLDKVLNERYGQRKFTEWLLKQIFKGTSLEYNEIKQYDVNNYGSPCTQYTFILNSDKTIAQPKYWRSSEIEFPTSECNYFFRIDKNAKGWYIAIRRYFHKGATNEQDDRHKTIRKELLEELNLTGDHSPNRKASKEQTLILFNFSTITDVKELIPILTASVNYAYEKSETFNRNDLV